jgi:cytochrome c oxidase subunit II
MSMTRRLPRYALVAVLALCACRGEQAVLSAHGPHAADIAQLAWALFAICGVVFGLVVVAVWLALRGSPGLRSLIANQRTVILCGIIVPAIVLTGLLGYGVALTRNSLHSPSGGDIQRIEVVGEQWWWRIHYRDPAGRAVTSANELRIPVAREVEFVLTSADVIHAFWIPSLGGKVDMTPGRSTRLRVRAERAGVFRGQCAEYCGGPHALMAFAVVALPQSEFERFLAHEAAPAPEPTGETERRGRELFLAAGCGACHAVRGTTAGGTVGPDLTHLASRRAIGADTAPMTSANLARFITHGQHIKPGNLMPQFRIFSDAERDAVAAYLMSLR